MMSIALPHTQCVTAADVNQMGNLHTTLEVLSPSNLINLHCFL